MRPRLGFDRLVMGGAALVLALLVVGPLVFLVVGGLRGDAGAGLTPLATALSGRANLQALANSLLLGAWAGLFSLMIGLALAWAVYRTDVPGKPMLHLTAALAFLTPPFLTAIAYVHLFDPQAGLINLVLRDVAGLPALTFNVFSMTGLVLVTALHTFPFVYLAAAEAFAAVDASYEESAYILGAGGLRTAAAITLPLIAPAVLAGTLLAAANAVALFGTQAVVGIPAEVFTLPTRIYVLFDDPSHSGGAPLLALLLLALTAGMLYLRRLLCARRPRIASRVAAVRPRVRELGPLRWVVFALGLILLVLAVAAPCATLLAVSISASWGLDFWREPTLANYRLLLFDDGSALRAVLNSLVVAALAAATVVLFGAALRSMAPARDVAGWPLVERTVRIPLAVPGIVLGVGVLHFWLAMPLALAGTLAILLVAYVARFLPLGIEAAGEALRRLDSSLVESAQILGAPWQRILREIALPLVRPRLIAGWLLVLVPLLQELGAAIILVGPHTKTLPVAVYRLYETGALGPLAAHAVVILALVAVAAILAVWLGGAAWARCRAIPREGVWA